MLDVQKLQQTEICMKPIGDIEIMAIYELEENFGVPILGKESWIAENAIIIGRIELGEQASVWYNAVLRGDCERITVGHRSNVQDGAIVHTDPGFPVSIGNGVTVGHLAMLHGCKIGDNSLIGIGATILNGAVIGKNCIIGAKALIPEGKKIPNNSLVMGIPGKIVREISDSDAIKLSDSADHYVENSARYRDHLRNL